jgi:hypothetical protein
MLITCYTSTQHTYSSIIIPHCHSTKTNFLLILIFHSTHINVFKDREMFLSSVPTLVLLGGETSRFTPHTRLSQCRARLLKKLTSSLPSPHSQHHDVIPSYNCYDTIGLGRWSGIEGNSINISDWKAPLS